ncbi:uncharacterized protein [Atheta coriaria]|uniref:uncharacterized protein isoform X2 n=1 Tax=Dalotia coriaria TaxID=877792 RepID=UPI0031F47317
MFSRLFFAFETCVILSYALPTPKTSSGAAQQEVASSAERFYDDKLDLYVDRIAEQIVDFNLEHHAKPHERGGKHEKHHHGSRHHFEDDSEEMQSDQPQPGQQTEQLLRQRAQDKLAMTNNIKEKVMLFITKGNGSKSYGERDRSFYANCDQPTSTEENDNLMKLYFTLSQLEDTIAAANLRLYRKSLTNHTTLVDNSDIPPCSSRDNSAESEKLYRVTLYYHVKGQKKLKLKKKIGDSQVIAESMPYVNLNVLHGVRELNKGKSFGVMVQIEDQFGTIVKAGDFFKGPSCTVGMPTPQPVPTAYEETQSNLGRNTHSADLIRKSVQPKLDVKTIQSPPEDETASSSSNSQSFGSSSSSTRCRHVQLRHTHGHHQQRTRAPPPPPLPLADGAVIVSKAGSGNYNVDMNQLRQLLNRIQEDNNKQQFSTT